MWKKLIGTKRLFDKILTRLFFALSVLFIQSDLNAQGKDSAAQTQDRFGQASSLDLIDLEKLKAWKKGIK